MKIRCKTNRRDILPASYFMPDGPFNPRCVEDAGLTVGKEYTVYALYTMGVNQFFYICEDGYDENSGLNYPTKAPMMLFDIIDPRLSQLWIGESKLMWEKEVFTLEPKSWIEDIYFYDKLTDSDPDAKKTWREEKRYMDDEY